MSHMRAAPKQGQGNGELQRVQRAECGVRPGKVTARKALLYESYPSRSQHWCSSLAATTCFNA